MSKLTKTTSLFLLSLALSLALIAGLIGAVLLIQKQNQEIADNRAELANEVSLMRSMQLVRRSVITSQDEQAELEKYFISQNSIPYFLGTLEAVAIQAGVDLAIARVGLSSTRDVLTVSVKVSGSFVAIHQYLEVLEYAPFRISTQRLLLRRAEDPTVAESDQYWTMDLDIQLLSYSEVVLPDIE